MAGVPAENSLSGKDAPWTGDAWRVGHLSEKDVDDPEGLLFVAASIRGERWVGSASAGPFP